MSPRIPPMEPPYSRAAREAFSLIMPDGMDPLLLFRTLAVNERVLSRLMAAGLLDRGTLSLRERELVIDRTCARLGSEYEWGVHVAFFGPKARLSEQDVAATCGGDESALSARDRLLFRLVDTLVDTASVPDDLWNELSREFQNEQLIELVVLVGYYHTIAFVTNTFQVPLEPFGARFPSKAP